MKNTATITSLLGLTQKQMALLLQVNRGQWSMYESGKRGLPLKAKQLLAEITGFLKFEDKGLLVQRHAMEQEVAKKKQLEKQLRENEDQLYQIRKKIAPAESLYNSNLEVIGLVDYLITQPSTKQALDCELLEVFSSQAQRALQKSGLANLTALRVKEELLELEKLILGSAIQKVNKNLQEIRA